VVPDSGIKVSSSLLSILWQKHYFCAAVSTGRICRPTLNQSEGISLLMTVVGQQKPLTHLSDVITVERRIHWFVPQSTYFVNEQLCMLHTEYLIFRHRLD
jgi:hypothetical protein